MKRILLFLFLSFLASGLSAQTGKQDSGNPSSPSHECYMMKDGSLLHCMGDNATPQREMVTFSDGATVTTKGILTYPNGDIRPMINGECIAMNGIVGDCEKMHASLKKDEHMH